MKSVTIGAKILIINEQKLATDNLENLVENLGTHNKMVQISEYMEFLDSFKPDIIITDISIKTDSLIEICHYLKTSGKYSDIPVVAVIENGDVDMVEKVLNADADDFIYSPLNLIELRSRISNQFYIVRYRRQWQNQLKHLEILNKEKNEILAIAAHDLKNPIFSIQLLGKTMRDDTTLTKDELYEFSNDIVASCDRIIDILKQLLDLNSIESGKIIIDIKQLYVLESVMHLIELYKHKAAIKNIDVNLEYSSDGIANTDLVSFNNIFDNIISNAIKYSPFNKSINVKVLDDNDKLVISVSDQGPGIPQSEQDKLFQKFAKISNQPTGGENSTGLGLSIVKKFSELINAEVKFENNSDSEGATFSVILPKY
jgi:two-component system, sensor histidine kinase and response regulator